MADAYSILDTGEYVPMPKVPKGGELTMQDVLGVREPFIPKKQKLESQLSQADLAVEEGKQRQKMIEVTGERDVKQRAAEQERTAQEDYQKQLEAEPLPAFIPTKDSAKDIAGLFSMVSVMGMLLGGAGKLNAMQALGAMNGMLEGHQKGRSDLYKKQATEFDKNFKAMTKRHEELRKKMEDAVKLVSVDKEAGMAEAKLAAAESGSDIIKAMVNRGEIVRALQTLNDTVQGREAALKLVLQEQDKAATRKAAADRDKATADYRKQELGLRRERLDLDKEKAETKATKVTQQTMMAQRAVNALGGVASAVESIKELPAGTTTGMLPNLQTKDGMMNYVRNTVGRKIASREAEMLNTLFTGVGRNLASIEASGAATGLSELSKQMQSGTYINSGTDDPYKVALKLADIRRIAVENIRPAIESGLMPKGQAETASKLVERIETAIPFTTIDVVKAANSGKQTIGQATEAAVRGGKSYKSEAEAEAAFKAGTLKAGEKVNIGGVSGTWE